MSISELRAIIPGRLYKATPMYWKTPSAQHLYFYDAASCNCCILTKCDEIPLLMALELYETENIMLKCLVGEQVLFLLLASASIYGYSFHQYVTLEPIGESAHE